MKPANRTQVTLLIVCVFMIAWFFRQQQTFAKFRARKDVSEMKLELKEELKNDLWSELQNELKYAVKTEADTVISRQIEGLLHRQQTSNMLTEANSKDVYQTAIANQKAYCPISPFKERDTGTILGSEFYVKKRSVDGKPVHFAIYKKNDYVSATVGGAGWDLGKTAIFKVLMKGYAENRGLPKNAVTFLDIGANVGWFSLNMAGLGYRVLAVEPMPANVKLLRESLCRSQLDNMLLLNYGVGEKDADCLMYAHNVNYGDGHMYCGDKSKFKLRAHHVETGDVFVRRLDDLISKTENIAIVKIDVEGFEPNVLKGGREILTKLKIPFIVSEFSVGLMRQKNTDPLEFLQAFVDAGYSIRDSFRGRVITDWQNLSRFPEGGDVYLVHESAEELKKGILGY